MDSKVAAFRQLFQGGSLEDFRNAFYACKPWFQGLPGTGQDNKEKCASPDAKMMEPIAIQVDGNIGAGKSTLLERFQELIDNSVLSAGDGAPMVLCVQEPDWTKLGRDQYNALGEFYKNPIENALPFQLCVFTERVIQAQTTQQSAKQAGDPVRCLRTGSSGRRGLSPGVEESREDGRV